MQFQWRELSFSEELKERVLVKIPKEGRLNIAIVVTGKYLNTVSGIKNNTLASMGNSDRLRDKRR